MTKSILFIDFDGTLCHDRFWRSLEPDLYEKVQTLLIRENVPMVYDWMVGKYTSEEVNKFAAEKLGIDYEKLWNIFVHDCETMNISLATLQKIQLLRGKYYTVLTTSNMDSLDRFTTPAHRLDEYFDEIVNSYNEGKLKSDNDGETFVEVANTYSAQLAGSAVFDDSENVCKVFENLGGKAYLVTSEQNLDFHLANIPN